MVSQKIKLEFLSDGKKLAGVLELPSSPRAYALFAHCFTCGKDIAAASRIARELVSLGFAVLRFDFTGLGNSEGEFANTNFSSNIQDLVEAANYLREHYQAPTLLVGHSLGGRAVLSAAKRIDEVRAVATIGAPADADHVSKQFSADLNEIEQSGAAEVSLAGRKFTIKKQFLDDIRSDSDDIATLRKPILVMHSPVDTIVSIKQAELIYGRAKHPKSFVSLDTADHLLSNKNDAQYAAKTIAAWAEKYIDRPSEDESTDDDRPAKGHVYVGELNKKFTRTIRSDHHDWIADEPPGIGDNLGPDPYEHLLAGLGACTSMTLRMYANRKKIPLDDVQVHLKHSRQHGEDCVHCDESHTQIDLIERVVSLQGDLTEEQRDRLIEIADKCPVHKTLENKIMITTERG